MRFIIALLAFAPFVVHAGADCKAHPKEEWTSEDTLKQALKDEGYTIKKFKVDGNCYEIYGKDKDGDRAEVYFNPVSGAIVQKGD